MSTDSAPPQASQTPSPSEGGSSLAHQPWSYGALALLPGVLAGGLALSTPTAAALCGVVGGLAAGGVAFAFATRRESQAERARSLAGTIAAGDYSLAEGEGAGEPLIVALAAVSTELEAVARVVGAAAERDLTETLEPRGALSVSVQGMLDLERTLIQNLSDASSELEAGTQEILAALRFQEQSSHEQAGAVEETRRTMDTLLQAAEQIAGAAEQVHLNAQRTRQSNETIAQRANQLNQLTQRISEALIGISAVADRTDILALNAALEGTKAGEAGKGFILVAEEMRRLAESVLQSVRQIQELVATIRETSQASVLATEEGLKLSEQTATSAETIRLTSQQQQSGTRQVTQSMNAVSDLLAQTGAGARECTHATAELNRRASELLELLLPFKLKSGNES